MSYNATSCTVRLYLQTIHVYVCTCIYLYTCVHTFSPCHKIRSICKPTSILLSMMWLMFCSLRKLSNVSSLLLFHMRKLELSETNAQKVQALSFLFFLLSQKWSVIVVTLRGFFSFDLYNAIIYKLMGGGLHFNFDVAASAPFGLLW